MGNDIFGFKSSVIQPDNGLEFGKCLTTELKVTTMHYPSH